MDFHNLDIDAVIRAASKKGALIPFANNPVNTSGFFTSAQKAPFTKIAAGDIKSRLPQYLPGFMADGTPVSEVCSAISEADRNRLVKAAKCPTPRKTPEKFTNAWFHDLKFQRISEDAEALRKQRSAEQWFIDKGVKTAEEVRDEYESKHRAAIKVAPVEFENVDTETGEIDTTRKAEGMAGQAFTIITHREWSDEYRVRSQIDQCSALPPEQEGTRESKQLSMGGAKKIADSCHYMHLKKGGYKTFLTLTIEPEQRRKLEAGEISIQKELGRFWDAMNQIRKRGFSYTMPSGEKRKIQGVAGRTVRYCWVIENPLNKDGERNPHIHILMDWGVPYGPTMPNPDKPENKIGCIFYAWAKRVEKVWGHGTGKLEKMKNTGNAGAYLAKAAGYLSKAAGADDQGPVKGNRYGISKDSRAPDWVQVGRYELAHMGHLIKDVHDYFGHLYGPLFAKRKKLNQALTETPKAEKQKRHAIGKALAKVREKCNALPAIAGKYQIMIKGGDRFNEFLSWASSDKARKASKWLPEKWEGEGWGNSSKKPDSNWFKQFKLSMGYRKAKRRWAGMKYEQIAEAELSKQEQEKPCFWDWLSYEKWRVSA